MNIEANMDLEERLTEIISETQSRFSDDINELQRALAIIEILVRAIQRRIN